MKRELNKDEKKLTRKGVERIKRDIKELKDNFAYNMDLLKKQTYLREFDDKWRNYLRRNKDSQDEDTLKLIRNTMEEKERVVKQMEKQLKEGVEKPIGV